MKINLFEFIYKIFPIFFAATAFAVAIKIIGLKIEKKLKEKFGESSEEKIERLTNSLKEASSLSSEIETEINRRQQIVEKLKIDQARFKQLACLKEQEVEAVVQTMRSEFKREGKKNIVHSVAINLVFFIAGMVATFLLKNI